MEKKTHYELRNTMILTKSKLRYYVLQAGGNVRMFIKISIKIKICSNEKENYDNFCYDNNPSRKENTVRALFIFRVHRNHKCLL